jgi:hypothetical protein
MWVRPSRWSAKLSRPILLKNGKKLVTLFDARNCLVNTFANVVRNDALGHAIVLLMEAAETGKLANRRAATVLRSRGLLR